MTAIDAHEDTTLLHCTLTRQKLHFATPDQIWQPHSKSYVALGINGAGVAWVGKGYVYIKATDTFVELPGCWQSVGGGTPREECLARLCERHCVVRSVDGRCDQCDG